ncbi:MAG: hypothetical protein ACJASL_003310, partial [Paraglaciecola sp.]
DNEGMQTTEEAPIHNPMKPLPWILLILSWLGFGAYLILNTLI